MSDRLYPSEPIVGIGAVVFYGKKVLLIKRGKPPLLGEWSLPGGKLEKNESMIEGIKREVYEECSILIDVVDIIDMFEYIERDKMNRVKFHYIVFDFKAVYKSGILQSNSDAQSAGWIDIDSIKDYKIKKETRDMILKGIEV